MLCCYENMGKLGPAESQSCRTHQCQTDCQKEAREAGSDVTTALPTQAMTGTCDTMDILWIFNQDVLTIHG